jgi:hypothetical protein
MSKVANRFRRKKPVITASVAIAEHFQAMEAERADTMAMLADLDDDFSGRFVTPYFFAEDDPRFKRWYENSRRSTNALFLDMIYDEEAERQEREEDEYDRRCEDAHADRYELRYGSYDRY